MDQTINADGSITMRGHAPFGSLVRVRNCLLEDGSRRTVEITGEPDTVFSVPARTTYKGKTVRGFLTWGQFGAWDDVPFFVAKHVCADYHRLVDRLANKAKFGALPPVYAITVSYPEYGYR